MKLFDTDKTPADIMKVSSDKMTYFISRLSLNLTAKWRAIRESEDLGKRYRLRPRLVGDYSKGDF